MRLYENEAKQIFSKYDLPIPSHLGVIESTNDLSQLDLQYPVVLKAMVLVGGRGKAGGIKLVNSEEKAINACNEIFNLTIKGYPVERILIEQAVSISNEVYLAVTTDPETFDIILVVSGEGGVDIESVAKTNPELIWKHKMTDNEKILPQEIADTAASFLVDNLKIPEFKDLLKEAISNLYYIFQEVDAKICEINPLILDTAGENPKIYAADAKMVLDDNALFRQVPLLRQLGIDPKTKRHDVAEQTYYEKYAYQHNFPYIDLLPDPQNYVKDSFKLYVGLVPGGAGYGIFSIDEVVNIGKLYFDNNIIPINFMDSGGGPSVKTVSDMFHLLMDHPVPDIIITSRFGGISSCDIFIQGLIMTFRDRFISKRRIIPVFGRMVGTDLANARAFLEKAQKETPEALSELHIIVGNQKIMADVIKEGVAYGLSKKSSTVGGEEL